jgi:SAM-dependent methyltransferase
VTDAVHPCARPGCSEEKSQLILRGEFPGTAAPFEFRRCDLCDMGFVRPWPSAGQVAALYSADYTYYADESAGAAREGRSLKFALAGLRYLHLVKPGLRSRFAAMVAALLELGARKTFSYSLGLPLDLPLDTPMLDYGCGTGAWLFAMQQRGYSQLAGFDIAANTGFRSRLAKEGIQVFDQAGLDEVPPGAFRLVRLEHVLEHLQSPARTLARIHQLLQPGGWLVLTIPSIYPWLNFPDLANSPHRPHLQLPMHLIHHSRESVERLIAAAGFELRGSRITWRERFITVAAQVSDGEPGAPPRI